MGSDRMSEFNWTSEELQEVVDSNPLVIFMKGTPAQPQCGFSNRGAQIVSSFAKEVGLEQFACVNVLSDPRARTALKEWSEFPTIPQVFVHGELIGGSDIVLEMYQDGSLKEMFESGMS
tara:strand:- start:1067 stop:1423 length:357 start_codon:yes stop_codon:yes gene_type:complete